MPNLESAKIAETSPVRRDYDVFNGDADGICAIHQLRLAHPLDAILLTGVKRDISLLERIPSGHAGEIKVCDISLDANVAALRRLLDDGCRVAYFDHHAAHQGFAHPSLQLFWDESPDVCTSLLMDRHLQGRFRAWAAVAAFGDNLAHIGRALAAEMALPEPTMLALRQLGTLLNYNAYGETVDDLYFAPDALYRALRPFADPMDFIAGSGEYRILLNGFESDAERMESLRAQWTAPCGAIYLLPNAPWARRIGGVFANRLAASDAGLSWAVLTGQSGGCYGVSVRAGAPMSAPAHRFCESFDSGGGRKAAAGINRLPASEIEHFAAKFFAYFGSVGKT